MQDSSRPHLCRQCHTFLEAFHIVPLPLLERPPQATWTWSPLLDLHNSRNSLTSRTIGILLQQSLVLLQFLQKPDYCTLQFALLHLDWGVYYWDKRPRSTKRFANTEYGLIWPNMHIWARQIWSSGRSLKRSCKMRFRRVGLRSIGPSSQKLWPNQIFGRFPHCNYNVKLKIAARMSFMGL